MVRENGLEIGHAIFFLDHLLVHRHPLHSLHVTTGIQGIPNFWGLGWMIFRTWTSLKNMASMLNLGAVLPTFSHQDTFWF